MRQWFEKNILIIILGILAILPTIVTYQTIFPYHIGKWLIAFGLIAVVVGVSCMKALQAKSPLPITATVLGVLIIIGIRVISGFTGVDVAKSFFGDALRLSGTTTWIVLLSGAVVFGAYLRKNPEQRKLAWYTLLYSGVFASIVGWLIQFNNGLFDVHVGVPGLSGRFIGLFGNETYFGAHVMMAALAGIPLWWEEKNKTKKVWATVMTLFVVVTVLVAKTRAGGIGLIAGALTFFGYALYEQKSKVLKVGATVGLVAIFTVGSLWVVAQREFFGTVDSVAQKILSVSGIDTRIYFWKTAYVSFLEKPLLGWGPENYEVAYDRHYPVGLIARAHASLYETWGERPHSIFFEYLASQGIIGLLIFMAALGLLLWRIRVYKGNEKYSARTVAALAVAYIAFGSLTFDTPSILFAMFMGVAVLISLEKEVRLPKIAQSGVSILLGSFAVWYVLFGVILPLQEMKKAGIVQRGLSASALSTTYENEVKDLFELRSIFHRDALKTISDDTINNVRLMNPNVRLLVLQNLENGLQEELEKNPHLFSLTLRLAQVEGFLAEFDTANQASHEQKARALFTRARELSPDRHVVDIAEVRMLLSLAKPEEALLISKKMEKIGAPPLMYFLQGLAQDAVGNSKAAAENLSMAINKGYTIQPNEDLIQYLIGIFEKNGYYEEIVSVLKMASRPNDAGEFIDTAFQRFQLAMALANLGRFDESISAATSVLEKDPTYKQKVEEFIETLQSNMK